VHGIKTSVPFFMWMLRQPAFEAAAFHTSYLDELLQQRRGEPFSTADASLEEVAAIAAALAVVRGEPNKACPTTDITADVGQTVSGPPSNWKARARIEGLDG
jgi:acetyl/propionyl-CoA carboxylase alpha subunit